tara:strand:+ start:7334 stop:9295 length:1962 start_codon:yes stop_codon:yes gene_type:complete
MPESQDGVEAVSRSRLALAAIALLACTACATSNPAQQSTTVAIEGDGTVHIPAMAAPPSTFLSEEGKDYLRAHLQAGHDPDLSRPVAEQGGMPSYMLPYLARMRQLYPVTREERQIAGVDALVYTPRDGLSPENAGRVLINLHGGGFASCFPGCAELESVPLSALGGFKVISLDYRQGPDHRFPAASEDVAAVYRELLQTYRPENIGIYGCSAGGLLTGMALAWFQSHDLPRPGAAGVFCSGLAAQDIPFGGDARAFAFPMGEGRLAPPLPSANAPMFPEPSYLAGASPNDPMVSPRMSDEVLAAFPPTLLITGTRGMEMSAAVFAHGQLVKAGADARLHVWDGMFHGFFYNPDVPESREAYDVMVDFFQSHLGQTDAGEPSGTGPYPALVEVDPTLPRHVLYRPARLGDVAPGTLGLALWGNGSCAADGTSARPYLQEIASHDYLVIAPGTVRSGPGGSGPPETTLPPDLVETTSSDLRMAMEWAISENRRPGSPYYGLIDEGQIAAMGYSCGGLQAIELAADPRIDAVIINNSGIFPDGATRIRNLPVERDALNRLHTPILYLLGGPRDVAYENGMADFHDIHHVPAMAANIDTGHASTFLEPAGGAVAEVAVDWLNWQLRGNEEAAQTFLGPDCRLCTDPRWTLERTSPE